MKRKGSINTFKKGLFTDVSAVNQPPDTYRYALNMVDETEIGDMNTISTEESDYLLTSLNPGFTPIGKIYLSNKKFAVWSVKDNISEIGILDAKSFKYEVKVNDENSLPEFKLNFSIKHQIQAVHRLRGGCDLTVYWVDGNSYTRYFNFNKPSDFQNSNGMWIAEKFNLQKTYASIPSFKSANILEYGGIIEPGSYNFAIQLVDADLNQTEWISSSPVIRVYNSLLTEDYANIHGSINSQQDFLLFPPTGKSIELKFSNLDTNYLYYRIAVIAANNGSGTINKVSYTDVIPTTKDSFIYTGLNTVSEGSLAEISMFNNILGKTKHIAQIENTLILGNVEGVENNYCVLQKYASQIKTDCITKEVILNDIEDDSNSKNPIYDFNGGVGYMPGEIYAKAIVFIYEGNHLSPAFHIPGKPSADLGCTYTEGKNVYPMSVNNSGTTTMYTDNDKDFWGVDHRGSPLMGKPVRHHRFPLRSEIGLPLVTTKLGDEFENKFYNLVLNVKGNLKLPVPCPEDQPKCGTDVRKVFIIKVDYKVNGESFFFTQNIDPNFYADNIHNNIDIDSFEDSRFHSSNSFTNIVITITDENDVYQDVDSFDMGIYFNGTATIKTDTRENTSTVQDKVVKSSMLGFKFSNIKRPSKEETGGLEVIGYYIVGAERTEFDKTILDTAVMFPSIVNNKYVSHGMLQPDTKSISKDAFGILHPEHKFNNREYTTYDKLIQEGNYKVVEKKYGKVNFDDVYDGSSYNSKAHKDGNDDGHEADGSPTSRGFDGWSLNIITRDNIVDFETATNFTINKKDIKENFYLDALDSKAINDAKDEYFNIASDNKIGVVQTHSDIVRGNLPYVVMYRENADPYSNFRTIPYYKDSLNPVYFNKEEESTTSVFNGDAFVTPMRYNNTVYWDNRVAERAGKKSILKIVLGAVIAIAGVVLAFATGGASTLMIGAGLSLIGAGALFSSSGIKISNFNKAYSEEYEKGLRQTALDAFTDMFYNYKNTIPFGFVGNGRHGYSGPTDDTIQWVTDCITDLWFESNVNMNLRNKFAQDESPTFLSSPWRVESGNDTPIRTWEYFKLYYTDSNSPRYPVSTLERHIARKLLVFDDARDDNRFYIGAPLGEYYHINPDYLRRNKEKVFFHLPLEYSCGAKCREVFKHRFHWSEQSFQEELTDNFRTFLPNNYKDIEGETGEITNLFRFGGDLMIHTEEALWQVPNSMQERITDQIVSFIGTGDKFSVPPRKVIDDSNGMSAGCIHKESFIKTPNGAYFVCENQAKIYRFDGKQASAISDIGESNWFAENIPSLNGKKYYENIQEQYPFKDNPSNPYGTGFVIGYDDRKERILVTKIDNVFKDFDYNDKKILMKGDKLFVIKDYKRSIELKEKTGWEYIGEFDGSLKFSKQVFISNEYNMYRNGNPISVKGTEIKTIFSYITGSEVPEVETLNNSWTKSFSLKTNTWRSYHSYFPRMYLFASGEFLSNDGDNKLWKHGVKGSYGLFRRKRYASTIEYILNNVETTVVTDSLKINTSVFKYFSDEDSYVEDDRTTFTKMMAYNSNQNTGELNLVVKENSSDERDYMSMQVANLSLDSVQASRKEKDWHINQLRDVRINKNKPIFDKSLIHRQSEYYTDKTLVQDNIDFDKHWSELESFRDKFLAMRLTFNNFENHKLVFNYSVSDEVISER